MVSRNSEKVAQVLQYLDGFDPSTVMAKDTARDPFHWSTEGAVLVARPLNIAATLWAGADREEISASARCVSHVLRALGWVKDKDLKGYVLSDGSEVSE